MDLDFRSPRRYHGRNWVKTATFALAALLLVGTGPAAAQSADEVEALKAEMEELKQGQNAILRDLAIIRQLLQRGTQPVARTQPPAFQPTELTIAGSPFLGQENAVVTLIEFTDYQCPFCRRHSASTKPQLVKDYVETGKLRYVMREFPIASIHPNATKAAEAALCARDQGKYWEMQDVFFQNQRKLAPEDLKAHAEGLGLDMVRFRDCLDGGKYTQRVRNDLRDGMKAGIRGTPSFFLGLTDPDDPSKIRATKMLRGAQLYAAFKRAIDALLAEAAKGS